MKLSILIPAYNEERSILQLLKKVESVRLRGIKKEVIVIDDGSQDKTAIISAKLADKNRNIRLIRHKKNQGKGTAIRTGMKYATGDIILIQDADLEYDPNDYKNLIAPIVKGNAKVVYGSRIIGRKKLRYSRFDYYLGGMSLTFLTNLLYKTNLSDESCGYKAFDCNVLREIKLSCKRFEFCPEVTAKIAKKGIKIYNVPVSYHHRSRKEGKKIKFRDWLEAVYTLIRLKKYT